MTQDVAARQASGPAAPRRVPTLLRERADQTASWPAVLAWGAGLVLTSLGAGAVTGNALTPLGIRIVGAPLLLIGLAALGWGVIAIARGTVVRPRLVIAGCLVGVVLALGALAVDPVGTSIAAVASASALLLALAMLAAFRLRRPATGARMGLIGLMVAALLVAYLTGTAVTAGTQARLTQGNAGVPVVVPSHH